jgi:hypothetical protein
MSSAGLRDRSLEAGDDLIEFAQALLAPAFDFAGLGNRNAIGAFSNALVTAGRAGSPLPAARWWCGVVSPAKATRRAEDCPPCLCQHIDD